MAEAIAFLAYGVTVTTESLLCAVTAWPRLQGPFLFLDLVKLRRDKGTICSVQLPALRTSVLGDIPSEVWDVVRHKLVDLEPREAEVALCCESCEAGSTWRQGFSDECEVCGGFAADFSGFEDKEQAQPARLLLRAFGLALPTVQPVPYHRGPATPAPRSPFADPRNATKICLPTSPIASERGSEVVARCGRHAETDEPVVVDVAFNVPPDAIERFRRLVSTLHLQLVLIPDGLIANRGTKVAEGNTRREKRECKEVSLDEIRPGWKLVMKAQMTR
ncbi:hypothetical protein JCM10450v2_001295 [Rhodotorula kratochvilovae]